MYIKITGEGALFLDLRASATFRVHYELCAALIQEYAAPDAGVRKLF